MSGTIASAGDRFSIIRSDEGRDYFAPGHLALPLGAAVTFQADPNETTAAGRRCTAHDVTAAA